MAMSRMDEILSTLLDGNPGAATLPELLCARCEAAVPVTGVGMALMSDDGHEGVVAATDGPARVMEDLQFTTGEGPCLAASRQGRPVLEPDLARAAVTRWPGFAPAALDAGIAAIFALPLQVGAIRLGVLDLYRDTPGYLDDDQLSVALAFADAATVVLLHLQNQTAPGEAVHPQLSDALTGRESIHQATGMIAVQAAVGLTEALLLLRASAFSADRPILEVAHDVVARRLRFPRQDEHPR